METCTSVKFPCIYYLYLKFSGINLNQSKLFGVPCKTSQIFILLSFFPFSPCPRTSRSTIMFIIFWDFLMVEQIFPAPQEKWSMIISNKLVYTSCLTSCWTEIRKYQQNLKTSQNYCLALSPPPKIKTLSVLARISRKTEIKLFL